MFLHLTGKAKNKLFYECFFNFKELNDASRLLSSPHSYILIDGTVMIFEKLDRPYYFMDGTRVGENKNIKLTPPAPPTQQPLVIPTPL